MIQFKCVVWRFMLDYHTFLAKAEGREDVEDIGCLVKFVYLSKEKLKKGDLIKTEEEKQEREFQAIVDTLWRILCRSDDVRM